MGIVGESCIGKSLGKRERYAIPLPVVGNDKVTVGGLSAGGAGGRGYHYSFPAWQWR